MIGNRVREARLNNDLTLEELANKVSTTFQAIQRLESGKTVMPRNLSKLADALGVKEEWLLTGKSEYATDKRSSEHRDTVSQDAKLITEAMKSLTKKQRAELVRMVLEIARENEEIRMGE